MNSSFGWDYINSILGTTQLYRGSPEEQKLLSSTINTSENSTQRNTTNTTNSTIILAIFVIIGVLVVLKK